MKTDQKTANLPSSGLPRGVAGAAPPGRRAAGFAAGGGGGVPSRLCGTGRRGAAGGAESGG